MPGQPDQAEELGEAHGGDAVTGGKGVVDLCLPVLAEPGGQRQQLGRGVDLFTAKGLASSIELADGGDQPWLSSQMR